MSADDSPLRDLPIEVRGRHFPVLGVKLRNGGNATALIWSLDVIVERLTMDDTPVMSASADTSGDRNENLDIHLEDHGWGANRPYEMSIHEDLLSELAPPGAMKTEVNVAGGGVATMTVCHGWLDQEKLRLLLDRERSALDRAWDMNRQARLELWLRNEQRRREEASHANVHEAKVAGFAARKRWPFPLPDPLQIEPIDPDWARAEFAKADPPRDPAQETIKLAGIVVSYRSLNGRFESSLPLELSNHPGGDLHVTRSGFCIDRQWVAYCALPPDSRYGALIDVDRGPHTRTYKVARSIEPGGIDYFEVEVASEKSCAMEVRLRLSVDKDQVIQTERASLRIANSRLNQFHRQIHDGGIEML